jgi:predicted transcriptional regulator
MPKAVSKEILIYESSPTKNIVGGFNVNKIHTGTPSEIWERCKIGSGIDESAFFEYCNSSTVIFAFEINNPFKFEHPMNPYKIFNHFTPPQSFAYIDCETVALLKQCRKRQL